ncbi:MAG: putative ABC transporter ATP-binding protein YknY [Alphaproteobacteria bacterium MarineAlpha5_Bin9]|nr:MAG: putative ABC transporter ATP-binding protein YknY [Alphaproteobacteria bacterium MarineAlpha5_Bin9]|tara:strand:+ start:10899 stop:11576 length:678 start_codon:yes stop_codon:yes gene_type:complete
MNKNLINIEDLIKKYKYKNESLLILNKINLKINYGDIISIKGPSGVGKTTLLNILGLLDSFDAGNFSFDNTNVTSLNDIKKNHFRNRNIGFIHQFFHLIPELNVIENVALPNLIYGNNKNESFKMATNLIKYFGLNERKLFKPNYLSGGEQQRVSIARALINKPKLIIADEMTGNLDEKTSDEIFDFFINEVKKNNQTLIFATHNNNYAEKANIKLTLTKGKIEY